MKRSLFGVIAAMVLIGPGHSGLHAQTVAPQNAAPAYFIAEFEVTDPAGLRPYAERVESTFTPFSGRFIVRSNHIEPIEGDAPTSRLIIIAFDSLEQARAWYNSSAYTEIRPIRQRSGHTNAYIVEGLPQ